MTMEYGGRRVRLRGVRDGRADVTNNAEPSF